MEHYLFVARSVTHAQQMLRALERGGIRARVMRASAEVTGRGCGYTLEVTGKQYPAALRRLSDAQLKPVRVIRRDAAEGRGS